MEWERRSREISNSRRKAKVEVGEIAEGGIGGSENEGLPSERQARESGRMNRSGTPREEEKDSGGLVKLQRGLWQLGALRNSTRMRSTVPRPDRKF